MPAASVSGCGDNPVQRRHVPAVCRILCSNSQPHIWVCCCEMLFCRVCDVRHNLYVFSLYRHPDLDDRFFVRTSINVCQADRWMCLPFSCLWVIWMAIIRSGWVLRPWIVMVLQPLSAQLCPGAISWLLAQPTHVVEHLTSWWLMFLTKYGLLF